MGKEYIERRDGGYWVTGTRVSLDSLVYGFLRGESPESLVRSFPTLSLEEVYGAITFYLANEETVNDELQKNEEGFRVLREKSRAEHPDLYRKIEAARQGTQAPRR